MPISLIDEPAALGMLQGSHRFDLVLLSWLVAFSAAYTGLDVSKLVSSARRTRREGVWLAAGAFMLGIGVWSMHFIGMHAYQLPFPFDHAPGLTMVSILPAILGSFVVLRVVSRDEPVAHRTLLSAGLALGAGIGAMHYLGMAAMRMPATLHYATEYFLLSLLVAVVFGILGTYAYRACRYVANDTKARACAVLAAVIVSLAISGMHYVAMAAAWFAPDAAIDPMATRHHEHAVWLVYLVSASAAAIVLLTLLGTHFQRRLLVSEQSQSMTRARLLEVISALQDGIVLFDDRARIRLCNAAFERMVGASSEELLGVLAWTLDYAEDATALNERIQEALNRDGTWRGTIEARHRDGTTFPARLGISRVNYADETTRDYVAMLTDISAEVRTRQHIQHLAYHDSLTGLPNRRALQERLDEMLENMRQRRCGPALLFLIDVDHFKFLNDSLGHAMGDELLRQLAGRLQNLAADRGDAARLDGNEFALLVGPLAEEGSHAAGPLARQRLIRVLATLGGDYELAGHAYPCRVSGGALVIEGDEPGHDELLKRADLALLDAKRRGDGCPSVFDSGMEVALEERLRLERELHVAIDEGQLRLYVQPQIDAEDVVFGAEALVRWEHPQRGLVSPGVFIPLAEESGLIVRLGEWVLETACRALAEWSGHPELGHCRLSVNVSVQQFQQPDFVDQVLSVLARHDVSPHRLTLELTESLLMEELDDVIGKMTLLRRMGISFALDDFGTGYSSLAYLKALPLDTLKIDVAFVRDLTQDPLAQPIARTIVALAEQLALKVVAEGVETQEQLTILQELGCGSFQGFLFARPQPVGDMLAWVRTRSAVVSLPRQR